DVVGIGGNGRLRPWRRNAGLWRQSVAHSLRLLDPGSNRFMSRRAATKARPHSDHQKSEVESNHPVHHTIPPTHLQFPRPSSCSEHALGVTKPVRTATMP